MNRAEFKKLALTRLDDARVLLRNRRSSAAYYVAGYAVECALKACLAKKTRRYEFPPKWNEVKEKYYTHNLQVLAKAGGLLSEFEPEAATGEALVGNPRLQAYWTIVKDWNPTSRYDPDAGKRAKDILLAVGDPKDGVLQCIKRFW